MDFRQTRRAALKSIGLLGIPTLPDQYTRTKTGRQTNQNVRKIKYGETKTGQIDSNDPRFKYSKDVHPHAEPISFNYTSGDEVALQIESSDLNSLFYAIETPKGNLWFKSYSEWFTGGWMGYHGVFDQDGEFTVWTGPYSNNASGQYTISLKKVGEDHILEHDEVIEEELSRRDNDWDAMTEKGGGRTLIPSYQDFYLLPGKKNQQTRITVNSPDFTPKVIYSPRSQQISNHSVAKGTTDGTDSSARFSHTFSDRDKLWVNVTALENDATGKYTIKREPVKQATSNRSFVASQGKTEYEITPLNTGETIEEFYGLWEGPTAASQTSTGIERSNTSLLFLWDGPNGLSLAVIHDKPSDGTGGSVKFEFTGLPTDSGEWVVMDDPPTTTSDFDGPTDTEIEWVWAEDFNDGGAFRGGLDEDPNITIDPNFNFKGDDRRLTDWQLVTGDAADPDRTSLSMTEPVTIKSRTNQEANEEKPSASVELSEVRLVQAVENTRLAPTNLSGGEAPQITDLAADVNTTVLFNISKESDVDSLPDDATVEFKLDFELLSLHETPRPVPSSVPFEVNKETVKELVSAPTAEERENSSVDDSKSPAEIFDEKNDASPPVFKPPLSLDSVTLEVVSDTDDDGSPEIDGDSQTIQIGPDGRQEVISVGEMDIGFIRIKDPTGEYYGTENDGRVKSDFIEMVEKSAEYIEKTYPVTSVNTHYLESPIEGVLKDIHNKYGSIKALIQYIHSSDSNDLDNIPNYRHDLSRANKRLEKKHPNVDFDVTVAFVPEGYFLYHQDNPEKWGTKTKVPDESAAVRGDILAEYGEDFFRSLVAQEVTHQFLYDPYPDALAMGRNGGVDKNHARTEHDQLNEGKDGKFGGRKGWLESTAYDLSSGEYNLLDQSPLESFMSYNTDEPSWTDTIAYQKLLESELEPGF